jgi:hypothetical protein
LRLLAPAVGPFGFLLLDVLFSTVIVTVMRGSDHILLALGEQAMLGTAYHR